jgi:hypothetical protein
MRNAWVLVLPCASLILAMRGAELRRAAVVPGARAERARGVTIRRGRRPRGGGQREGHAHLATRHSLVGFVVLGLALLVSAAAMLPKKRWGIVVRWFGRLTLVCGILSSILGALQAEQLYGENEQVMIVELVLGAILVLFIVLVACLANVCGRSDEPDEARLGYLGSRYIFGAGAGRGPGSRRGLAPVALRATAPGGARRARHAAR